MDSESGAPSLREQFQLLQDQQKERYRSRKVLKSGQVNEIPDESPIKALSMTEDRLDLLTASEESGTTTTLEEDAAEVHFLQKQVEQLQLDNVQLQAGLKRKDHELSQLQRSREEERLALGGVSSTAAQRIVDLSKRNREVTAELTAERNRVRQLQKKMKESIAAQKETPTQMSVPLQPSTASKEQSVIAQLQDQLLHVKHKMTEYRNECQLLKQDMKLAHRVLAKEVGEGVTVSALLSGVSGWRGRAQQIIALQNKVAELKQRLEQVQGGGLAKRVSEDGASRIEARQKAALQRIERERVKNLEETRLELENAQSEYMKVQQQCSALKARNKTLAADVKSLKTQLLQKKDHLIVKSESTGVTSCKEQKCLKEKEQLLQANKDLQRQLVVYLSQLQSLKRVDSQTHLQGAPSSVSGTCTQKTNRLSLPPLVDPKPPVFRKNSHLHVPGRKSMSAGHLSSNHDDDDSIEAHALAQVSQVERDRLLELTLTLQQRLDATTDKLVRLETDLRSYRHENARLLNKQKQVERLGVSELESRLALQLNENLVLKETLELTRHEKIEDIKLFHSMLQEAKQLFVGSVRQLQL